MANESCPKCGSIERYILRRGKIYRCKSCGFDYSATSGTRFASSKLTAEKQVALTEAIRKFPTLSAQKIASIAGVSLKTAWLWKVRIIGPDGAAKGYFQGRREASGKTVTHWHTRSGKRWSDKKNAIFDMMWAHGCPGKCMGAMFGIEPGTVSNRARSRCLKPRLYNSWGSKRAPSQRPCRNGKDGVA